MAIFGRRTTQRLIDETATVITRRQINKIVDELNEMPTTETLSPDWELILLNVFSKIGRVKHERSFGGNTRPDLFFECRSHPDVRYVADIRTLSDKGFTALGVLLVTLINTCFPVFLSQFCHKDFRAHELILLPVFAAAE